MLDETCRFMADFVVNHPLAPELWRVQVATKSIDSMRQKFDGRDLTVDDARHVVRVCRGIGRGFADGPIEFSEAIEGDPFLRAFMDLSNWSSKIVAARGETA